ncbi:MAG: oligopeptide/dipeptide transporter, ATPase subunit [Marmoricola sp.]|nr:oligopeptide/dipeptide transporter, ATPase subunit [Marmoricola sp.]
MSLLEVRDLRTEIDTGHAVVRPVDGVTLHVDAGEVVGLVGESGSGKSMTGMSIMGLLPQGGRVASGSISFDGRELTGLGEREMRGVRGAQVGMVFQDPMSSLNPTMTIGRQIAEAVKLHRNVGRRAATQRTLEVLGLVGMPRPADRLDDYPHQLSGGMRQRVMIAMALAAEPSLLIADEPTTALDVTIQAQILDLLVNLRERLDMGVLLVTHDMGVIAERADRVLVMYAGRIVESGPTAALFAEPRHPYTEALLASIPKLDQDRNEKLQSIPGQPPDLANPPEGCRFASRCRYATDLCRDQDPVLEPAEPGHAHACFFPRSAANRELIQARVRGAVTEHEVETTGTPLVQLEDVHKEFPLSGGLFRGASRAVHAVSGVSLEVRTGETFALVGESGCGKTTLGRMIVSLERPTAGSISFDGVAMSSQSGSALRARRRDVQLVFQDAASALDPRMTVGASLSEPLRIQGIGDRNSRQARVLELLDQVGLPTGAARRRPHEFSGGQRQRIGIARALALQPRLVVADEPVSALDVSVQSQVLNLMKSLQEELGLTYVVISHDLSVVKYLADRVGVMYLGKLVEVGRADQVYEKPAHPYTDLLLKAIPEPDPADRPQGAKELPAGELPSAIDPPSGCRFRTRCPLAQEICATTEPPLQLMVTGQQAACHFPLQQPVGDTDATTAADVA